MIILRIRSDVRSLLLPFHKKQALFLSHNIYIRAESLAMVCKGKEKNEKDKEKVKEKERNSDEATFENVLSSNNIIMIFSRDSIYRLLRQCIEEKKGLIWVRRIHFLIVINGLEWIGVLTDHLIRAYACCGCLSSSNQVFSKLSVANIYTWNTIISVHVNFSEYDRAFDLYSIMPKNGSIRPDKITFLCMLQACSSVKSIGMGRILHEEIVCIGLDSVLDISSSLVHMYAQCGSVLEAHKVFNGILNRDVVSWGAIISGYARFGCNTAVFELFEKLQGESIQPDRGMYMCFIKCCTEIGDIEWGRKIHGQVRESVFSSDIILASAIIDMYSACGSLAEAYDIFGHISNRDVVTWGAMMSAYIHHGLFLSALRLYEDMEHDCVEPDHIIFSLIIKACIKVGNLLLGRWIHADVICRSLDSYMILNNSLIDLYMKFGSLEEANNMFDKSSKHEVATWDIMIGGYLDNRLADVALTKFYEMKGKEVVPNEVTYLCMLKVCSRLLHLKEARLIHDEIIRSKLESDIAIGNAMVDMYAKCQSLEEAEKVFNSLRNKDVISWGALIGGFAQSGDSIKALDLLQKMKQEGTVAADEIAYLSGMKAIGSIRACKAGHVLHDQIIRCGFESHSSIGNSLVDMYAKCGSLEEAHKEFNSIHKKDVITWGTMIGGYALNSHVDGAFLLFEQMQQGGFCPDQATFVCVLKACGLSRALEGGRFVHGLILQSRFADDKVIGNALIDMYVKCGDLWRAHRVFDTLPIRDIVSWSSMIGGYARNGFGHDALDLYEQMHQEGLEPSRVSYLCTLQACASIGAVEYGRLVHEHIKISGLEFDMALGNTLMDLYVQYGEVERALEVFEELPSRNLVSWNVLMDGYASHGNYSQVIRCFHTMVQEGLTPDDIVFTTILEACNNAILLQEAFLCFNSMNEEHCISPNIDHYNYLSNILVHGGMLREAFELTHTIPWTPDRIMWISLLKKCTTYGSEESGCRYFDRVQGISGQVGASKWLSENSTDDSLLIESCGFSELRGSRPTNITHMEVIELDHDDSISRNHDLDLKEYEPKKQSMSHLSNGILLTYVEKKEIIHGNVYHKNLKIPCTVPSYSVSKLVTKFSSRLQNEGIIESFDGFFSKFHFLSITMHWQIYPFTKYNGVY